MIGTVHLLIALAGITLMFAILVASPRPNSCITASLIGPLQMAAHIVAQIALT